MDNISNIISDPLVKHYIESCSADYCKSLLREHEMILMLYEKRLNELERAAKPFLLNDTSGLSGFDLHLSQFKNTILRFMFPSYRKEPGLRYGARSKLNRLDNHRSLIQATELLAEIADIDDDKRFALSEIRKGTIYIDITRSLLSESITGIQRVAFELARSAVNYGAIPVITKGDEILRFSSKSNSLVGVKIVAGDIFLMPEGAWDEPQYCCWIMDKVKRCGGKNVTLLHDLIALYMPEVCYPGVPERIDNWLRTCALQSDAVICVSRSTSHDLLYYLENTPSNVFNNDMRIGWSHSGVKPLSSLINNDRNFQFPCSNSSMFLSVGTIEPRKGYSIALDAFEILWSQGIDVTYVIVGRHGWHQEQIVNRIKHHVEYNKRLFLFVNVDDLFLSQLYLQAHRLICSSIYEGFGLPIIEAAYYDLPTIASDIPAFRELGDNQITFFDVADCQQLATKILLSSNDPSRSTQLSYLTWDQSALNTMTMIYTSSYQMR